MIKRKNRLILTILAVISAIILNGIFSNLNNLLELPIFLDSIFTIMTAALFGLWPSLIVALFSNFFIELLNGFPGIYYPFAIVNILTAVTTSLIVNKKLFETANHAFWLILLLSFINSFAGAIIVTIVFSGYTNLSIDYIVKSIILSGQTIISASFLVRLIVNIVDKGIGVLLTFFVYKSIQKKASKQV
jgi:energy-coupling factor transport system substrate-specific component